MKALANPTFTVPFWPVLNIVSLSGGKDSLATLLVAIERKAPNLFCVFSDTGNEHQDTYDYVNYIEKATGVSIVWLKADFSKQIEAKRQKLEAVINYQPVARSNWTVAQAWRAIPHMRATGNPFLDLCILKGRFPSTKARFCSTELKREVILYQLQFPLTDQGYKIVSWQGVRSDESEARKNLPQSDRIGDVTNYRPILKWNVNQVFAIAEKHGIKPNPLYTQGMGRVGCMPCIHARKDELKQVAARFPDEINRIENWEQVVSLASKRGGSTFFPTADSRGDGVRALVEWSKTERGGKQYSLISATEDYAACSSIYGLCE